MCVGGGGVSDRAGAAKEATKKKVQVTKAGVLGGKKDRKRAGRDGRLQTGGDGRRERGEDYRQNQTESTKASTHTHKKKKKKKLDKRATG